ncbi:MAG: SUMF1/EgtB/PvdO family nonheme iron enzyme, partial [Candidatus Omnitrophica bacterium]|nr:SUMF1/EgtB/PvdO family nonheme iron enzyme [Candidatus Omnitrophota bacterium]
TGNGGDFTDGRAPETEDLPFTPKPSDNRNPGRWEPPSPETIQEVLPKYEVESLIGRGGMGAVYKGVQRTLGRTVAIKILPPGLGDSFGGNYSERFKNEARAMGGLSHPGIVRVFDFGETSDGLLYFVMEFIHGIDVEQIIKQFGRLPPDHALSITAFACDALSSAHAQGIVHRDIKPSNLIVAYDGRVLVADFGLAKELHGNLGLTRTNVILGTPAFMAPEAMTGDPIDGRADLYSLGITVYAMLIGKVPRGMPQMPSQLIPGLNPHWDDVISRSLRHNPNDRYQTAAEFRLDLNPLISAPILPQSESGRNSRVKKILVDLPAKKKGTTGEVKEKIRTSRPKGKSGQLPAPGKLAGGNTGAFHFSKWIYSSVGIAIVLVTAGFYWLSRPSGQILSVEPVPKPISQTVPPASATPAATSTTPAAASVVANESGKPDASRVEPPPADSALISATKKVPFENSLGMKFVPIPGTDILMCIHETRYKDFETFSKAVTDLPEEWKAPKYYDTAVDAGPDHPALAIDWHMARSFCAWLTSQEGHYYRLPTDVEWSRAVGLETEDPSARYPVDRRRKIGGVFPWGSEWPPPPMVANIADESTKSIPGKGFLPNYNDGFATSSPVMSFPPNRLGLYDLSGNALEWCLDLYAPNAPEYTMRGGGWGGYGENFLLSSDRYKWKPDYRFSETGFRVVIDFGKEAPIATRDEAFQPQPTMEWIEGVRYFRWKGKHVDWLLRSDQWDPAFMERMIVENDAAFEYLVAIFGQRPKQNGGRIEMIQGGRNAPKSLTNFQNGKLVIGDSLFPNLV